MKGIIMRRPGILIVAGEVVTINGNTVTLKAQEPLPGGTETDVFFHITMDKDISRFHLQQGSVVIASTTDDFSIEMLREGAALESYDFALYGHILRFTGSFDFPEHGGVPEEHVFAGSVLDAREGVSPSGKPWQMTLLSWRRNGVEETKTILSHAVNAPKLTKGQRVIAVTGPKKTSVTKGADFYVARAILNAF